MTDQHTTNTQPDGPLPASHGYPGGPEQPPAATWDPPYDDDDIDDGDGWANTGWDPNTTAPSRHRRTITAGALLSVLAVAVTFGLHRLEVPDATPNARTPTPTAPTTSTTTTAGGGAPVAAPSTPISATPTAGIIDVHIWITPTFDQRPHGEQFDDHLVTLNHTYRHGWISGTTPTTITGADHAYQVTFGDRTHHHHITIIYASTPTLPDGLVTMTTTAANR